jgi:hypothetical protein
MTRKTKQKKTAQQYLAVTPNPEYKGKTCGVQFYQGKALIAPHTISPFLGWTVDEIVVKMRQDFGYDVQPVEV